MVTLLREHRHGTSVCRIDMQPKRVLRSDLGHGIDRIHSSERGRTHGGDDGNRVETVSLVRIDGRPQEVRLQCEPIVARDLPASVEAAPQGSHRLLDRRVRLLGTVDDDAVEIEFAAGIAGSLRNAFPGPDDRVQARSRSSVVDHAEPIAGQGQQPGQPSQNALLDFRQGGRRVPQQSDVVQCRDQRLRQDSRAGTSRGEIAHEARVVPVQHVRQDLPLEVGQNLGLGRWLLRGLGWKLVK